MRVKVIGQKGDGPVMQRTVSLIAFIEAWGPFAPLLWQRARDETLEIEGHRIRVVLEFA